MRAAGGAGGLRGRPPSRAGRGGIVPEDTLTPAALQRLLRTAIFGHRVFYYPVVGSTNDRALELAAAGEPEGSVVLAERQTRGRGRRARSWSSPARLGIYASLILRPALPAAHAPLLTFVAAVSVAEALRRACSLRARIKWPNDVLVRRRKIAGVLGEMRGTDPDRRDLVVGIGVNVNHGPGDFPAGLRGRATSVRVETGRPTDRAGILAPLLEGFERRYARLLRDGAGPLLGELESLSVVAPGRRVVVEGPAGRIDGKWIGVDHDGALLLRGAGGATLRAPFGELVLAEWS
ncbi:MAG: biotin--[acetyl-CoA-carboxylase] ligase [Acidobacteriota bacterium]